MTDDLSPRVEDAPAGAGGSGGRERASRWRRWVAESAVIVFSILLAFAIDAAWARMEENQRRREILNALLLETRANLTELDLAAERLSSVAAATDLLVEWSVGEGVPEDVSADSLDGLLISAGWFEVFQLGSSTVDAVVQSGGLELIRNDSLTASLIRWRELVRISQEVVATSVDFTYRRYTPWLDERAEMLQVLDALSGLPPDYPAPNFARPDPPMDHAPLVRELTFRNLVAEKRSIVADIEWMYESFLRSHLRRMETMLQAELER